MFDKIFAMAFAFVKLKFIETSLCLYLALLSGKI